MKISLPIAFAPVSRYMNTILLGKLEPFVGSEEPGTMLGRSTIWGAFAEPVRLEEEAAAQLILQAAREWLALPHYDIAAITAYLDRWDSRRTDLWSRVPAKGGWRQPGTCYLPTSQKRQSSLDRSAT
jgi:hypothetical protein